VADSAVSVGTVVAPGVADSVAAGGAGVSVDVVSCGASAVAVCRKLQAERAMKRGRRNKMRPICLKKSLIVISCC
jgi:uncharacterized membrane protein YidH (DUF202 family)